MLSLSRGNVSAGYSIRGEGGFSSGEFVHCRDYNFRGLSSNVSRRTHAGTSFLKRYLTQVARAAILSDIVVVCEERLDFTIMPCTVPNLIYILHLATEGRGEKVSCVAASALHSVPILHFLVVSGLLHCLYCSVL